MLSGPFPAAAAALVAILAGLPGLGFPLLAEDWPTLAAAGREGWSPRQFGYFRPLYSATFWIESRAGGASPLLAHLVNLLLIAACAALVVVVARRYTADPWIAAGAGMLFAAHPWHVENAAWVAARADQLWSLFALLAALGYDRWRDATAAPGAGRESAGATGWPLPQPRRKRWRLVAPVPLLSLFLLEAAFLSKESAVVAPLVIVAIGLLDPQRRPTARELGRGYLPMLALAAVHLLWVRPLALGATSRTLMQGEPLSWLKRVPGYAAGALLPLDVELLGAHPFLWGAIAAAGAGTLLLAARLRSGCLPRSALAGAAIFFVLIPPALVGFQERYLFLAAAASGLFVAALVRSVGGRPAAAAALLIAGVWLPMLVSQWRNWQQAAGASRSLVSCLVQASLRGEVEEIVVANMPFRVRGGGVFVWGDFRDALALSGGRLVPVRAAAYVSYRSATEDALDGALGGVRGGRVGSASAEDHVREPVSAQVQLRIVEGAFSHYHGPGNLREAGVYRTPVGTVEVSSSGRVRIEIPLLPGGRRGAYVWTQGRLDLLF